MFYIKIRAHPPWFARGTPVVKLRDGPIHGIRGKPLYNWHIGSSSEIRGKPQCDKVILTKHEEKPVSLEWKYGGSLCFPTRGEMSEGQWELVLKNAVFIHAKIACTAKGLPLSER